MANTTNHTVYYTIYVLRNYFLFFQDYLLYDLEWLYMYHLTNRHVKRNVKLATTYIAINVKKTPNFHQIIFSLKMLQIERVIVYLSNSGICVL